MVETAEQKKRRLQILKERRWKTYKKWTMCYCPALQTHIHFTVDGFFHLHTEPSGRIRTIKEQLHKMGLLPFAPVVIKNANTTITYDKKIAPVGRKRRDGVVVKKEFEYWSLRTKVHTKAGKEMTVKVVLRKATGSTKTIFWSIMM